MTQVLRNPYHEDSLVLNKDAERIAKGAFEVRILLTQFMSSDSAFYELDQRDNTVNSGF